MNKTDSFFDKAPAPELGFTPPLRRPLGQERAGAALASLIASVALVVATLVAAAAVSSGPAPSPLPGPASAGWSTIQRG